MSCRFRGGAETSVSELDLLHVRERSGKAEDRAVPNH